MEEEKLLCLMKMLSFLPALVVLILTQVVILLVSSGINAQQIDPKYLREAQEIADAAIKNANQDKYRNLSKETVDDAIKNAGQEKYRNLSKEIVSSYRASDKTEASKYYPERIEKALGDGDDNGNNNPTTSKIKKRQTHIPQTNDQSSNTARTISQTRNSNLSSILPQIKTGPSTRNEDKLLVFISSSMPLTAIASYLADAKKYGATVIIKGFIGDSLKNTITFFKRVDKNATRIKIDPHNFEKFAVRSVPTIILIDNRSEAMAHDITPIHDRISGNVPLRYALLKFSDEGDLKDQAELIRSRGDDPGSKGAGGMR